MQQPYTAFIPHNIAWYTPTNWPNTTAAPSNPDTPRQLWRDNGVVWEAQSPTKWWEPAVPLEQLAPRTYTIFAFNADGTPALTPINSQAFLQTYTSKSVVETYREFHFRFPAGVPYTKQITVPAVEAGNLNFGGKTPETPYPVQIPTDIVFEAKNGTIVGTPYQEWLKDNQPPPMTDEQQLALVAAYLGRQDFTAAQKKSMIRQLLMDRPVPVLI